MAHQARLNSLRLLTAGGISPDVAQTNIGGAAINMFTFPVYSTDSAPEAAKESLAQAKRAFGFVPNLLGVLAQAPQALKAYVTLSSLFSKSSLSPTEQQVVLLTVSFENECHYCMAAHTAVAKMSGLSDEVVSALRSGEPLGDSKLEALRDFTRKIVKTRGWIGERDARQFAAAGYHEQQVLEVILGVTMKTLSNYTNHIAQTPLDPAFEAHVWRKAA